MALLLMKVRAINYTVVCTVLFFVYVTDNGTNYSYLSVLPLSVDETDFDQDPTNEEAAPPDGAEGEGQGEEAKPGQKTKKGRTFY